MYCRSSAGQDVSVLLFVWCLLFYVPPSPRPLSILENVPACWNSHHTAHPIKGFSPWNFMLIFLLIRCRASFPLIASFSLQSSIIWELTFILQLREVCLCCHTSFTPPFLSTPHRHPIPLGVGWISIIPLRYNEFEWALITEFVIAVFHLWYAFKWLLRL